MVLAQMNGDAHAMHAEASKGFESIEQASVKNDIKTALFDLS